MRALSALMAIATAILTSSAYSSESAVTVRQLLAHESPRSNIELQWLHPYDYQLSERDKAAALAVAGGDARLLAALLIQAINDDGRADALGEKKPVAYFCPRARVILVTSHRRTPAEYVGGDCNPA